MEDRIADADPNLIKLLKGMLEFNPYFRLTAKQALRNKIFDKIREPHFEKPSPVKIKQDIHNPDFFRYSSEIEPSNEVSIHVYKSILKAEIRKI